jgi:hypothetical protein
MPPTTTPTTTIQATTTEKATPAEEFPTTNTKSKEIWKPTKLKKITKTNE